METDAPAPDDPLRNDGPEPLLQNELNRVILEGILDEPPALKSTPSGGWIAKLVLVHHSRQGDRIWALRLPVTATGKLAEFCRTLPSGQRLRVVGALDQKRWMREGRTRWGGVELTAESVERLETLEQAHDGAPSL
ncbi:MAG: single-stranded DNA-binding protein [Magnetococcales bacterium]|nr:single-stranded DNA-binding protein [Magnetococcales bacterium]